MPRQNVNIQRQSGRPLATLIAKAEQDKYMTHAQNGLRMLNTETIATTACRTVQDLTTLQPIVGLDQLFSSWDEELRKSTNRDPRLTHYFHTGMPAITHIGLCVLHFGFPVIQERYFEFLFLRFVRDRTYSRFMDGHYGVRLHKLAGMISDERFAHYRKDPEVHLDCVIDDLHSLFLTYEKETRVVAECKSPEKNFSHFLRQKFAQADSNAVDGWFFMYRVASKRWCEVHSRRQSKQCADMQVSRNRDCAARNEQAFGRSSLFAD